ncbi:MAG: hypothetical protein HN909_02005 [Phycisphaerales bacterium]|jgi:hypothetical protein|nr:hypothetical protein [Phycisphaerales bacterium]MBT7170523.1 hypothetical protein [Phycisphaerales bacterium]
MAEYETQVVAAFATSNTEAEELVELLSDHGIEVTADRDYDGPGSENGIAMLVDEEYEEEAKSLIDEHSDLDIYAASIATDDEELDVTDDDEKDPMLGTELDSTGSFQDDEPAVAAAGVGGLEESVLEDAVDIADVEVAEEEAPDFLKALFSNGDDVDEYDEEDGDGYDGPKDLFDDSAFFEEADGIDDAEA